MLDKAVKIDLLTGIYTLQATAPIFGNTLCFTRPCQNTLYRSGLTRLHREKNDYF